MLHLPGFKVPQLGCLLQESFGDSRVKSTLHATKPLFKCEYCDSSGGRVEIGEYVEHLVANLRLMIYHLDDDVIDFSVLR